MSIATRHVWCQIWRSIFAHTQMLTISYLEKARKKILSYILIEVSPDQSSE